MTRARWACWSPNGRCRLRWHQSLTDLTARAKRAFAVRRRTIGYPPSGLRPALGEAEEVERRVAAVAPAELRPEVDEPRLGRVEREPVPAEPLSQDVKHPPGVPFGLEEEQRVIGIPHEPARSPHPRGGHCLEPFIQHMVQENV